ncbi:hypothetical protein PCANC_16243 [Puccinia coronata f. sp. avenae]|uniref:HORMA domain-containing protein n=1 Tax=Puccinia coronata f. sp. avenae TaxID=200324 RepID=A0A2N5SVD6_9BASI|nr:hypothetical protein PCANC_16243 [Puccinia coronata f. sp. avenae]
MSTQMKTKPIKSKTANSSKTSTDAQLMTSSQSLNVVKTLIQTGIGVITYLRGIFPEEYFNDDRIGPDRSENSTYDDGNEGQKTGREGRGYIRVKHLKRGASKESDKVMDYLDEGAMDAIQRGYLRQLLFAMYLDPNKPRDVIECYTFNITYFKSTQCEGELVPELEVRDQLRDMSLGGKISLLSENDPQQSRKTCGMVKRQVQALIKNLICSTQSLSDIHGRRFLTFKLHYNNHTPLDYEPPHFKAGDAELDRFTFGTSGVEEVPSTTEMGRIDTGFHAVRVALATISGYLPEPNASDSKVLPKGKSPLELREIELDKVREEAKARKVVWDTETFLASSPPITPNGLNKEDAQSSSLAQPIGRRDSNDHIVPLPRQDDVSNVKEPGTVMILKRKATPEANLLPETDSILNSTQTEVQSQLTPVSVRHGGRDENLAWSLKSSEWKSQVKSTRAQEKYDTIAEKLQHDKTRIAKSNRPDFIPEQARPQSKQLVNHHSADTMDDDPIEEGSIPNLNLNAASRLAPNVESFPGSFDPIESFTPTIVVDGKSKKNSLKQPAPTESKSKEIATQLVEKNHAPQKADSNKKMKYSKGTWPPSSNKSDVCECRDANDDQDMIICEICKRWRHLNCYGYTSEKDQRIPEFFVCYRCRIHRGMGLEEIWKRDDDINIALEGLRGLCIFRRTLQIIYQEGLPAVLKDLALRLEVDLSTVSQIKHRLETEKFICPKPTNRSKTSGILESERKGSGKLNKSKKIIKHMIVNESYEQKKLRDKLYFTPGTGAEAKLLENFGNESIDDDQDEQHHVEKQSLAFGSLSRLSSIELGPVNAGGKRENGVTPTKKATDSKSPIKATAEHIIQPTEPAEGDITMHDASQDQRPEESKQGQIPGKNKVSIETDQVEVQGVTWEDDCDE